MKKKLNRTCEALKILAKSDTKVFVTNDKGESIILCPGDVKAITNKYEKMEATLRTISEEYQSAGELKENSESFYGLEPEEGLEMAYENIQEIARIALQFDPMQDE